MTATRLISAALLTSALVALGGVAHAAGTAPGVNISNSIDLSYDSGGDRVERSNAASVDFVVDRKVDFVLEAQTAGETLAVEQGAEDQFLVFYLENEGNDLSGYLLELTSSGSLNMQPSQNLTDPTVALAPGEYQVIIGTDPAQGHAGDTVYDSANPGNIGDLAADASRYIKIRANIPDNAPDGSSAQFALTATAVNAGNPANAPVVTVEQTGQGLDQVDTILADPAEGGKGAEASSSTYQVQAPQLSGQKTVEVISQNLNGSFNCATGNSQGTDLAAVPGACLEYQISVTNATGASVPASNLSVSDVLPDGLVYVEAQAGDFDAVSYDAATKTVTADLASLPQNQTAQFTIRVTIE